MVVPTDGAPPLAVDEAVESVEAVVVEEEEMVAEDVVEEDDRLFIDDGDSSPGGGMAYISISARHALPPSKYPRGKLPQIMANDDNVVTNNDGPATTTNYNNMWMANERQSPQQQSRHPLISLSHGAIGGRVTTPTPTPPSSTSWTSSYEIWNEGIMSNNWLEKHTCILPSSILIVIALPTTPPSTKTKGSNDPPTTAAADMADNEQQQQQQQQI